MKANTAYSKNLVNCNVLLQSYDQATPCSGSETKEHTNLTEKKYFHFNRTIQEKTLCPTYLNFISGTPNNKNLNSGCNAFLFPVLLHRTYTTMALLKTERTRLEFNGVLFLNTTSADIYPAVCFGTEPVISHY